MYAKNITTFVQHLVKDGAVRFDQDDEIIRDTLVTHRGQIVNARIKNLMT
jgi:NAD(P) transhydrogenase subunit alpha